MKAIAKLPNFRYDLKMLNEGEQLLHAAPGPNDPAGVIWIALNKKGVGIHGASDPDSIGRNASHGRIRLANWDETRRDGETRDFGCGGIDNPKSESATSGLKMWRAPFT